LLSSFVSVFGPSSVAAEHALIPALGILRRVDARVLRTAAEAAALPNHFDCIIQLDTTRHPQ